MFGNYEFLSGATTRIEILNENGEIKSTGTAFFFMFKFESKTVPCLITNKHVVLDENGERENLGRFFLHERKENGTFKYESRIGFEFSGFGESFIFHPNDEIDLCAFPLAVCLYMCKDKELYIPNISELMIPDDETLNTLSTVEDVIMVGYPNGLWDDYNNLPIIRKGATATHPKSKYKGKNEFVIDVSCYPGSSGSPIFIVDEESYVVGSKRVEGNRIVLLGALYSGPTLEDYGEVVDLPFKMYSKHISLFNLGYVINSQELLHLKEIVKEQDAFRIMGKTQILKVKQ